MITTNESHTRGTATRHALIEAGTALFGRLGFHGTSTRALADAAGVNQALIGFHFGGKEGLYQAVFEHIAEQLCKELMPSAREMDALVKAEETENPPSIYFDAAIRTMDRLIDTIVDPHLEPWVRLILQEQQDPTSAFDAVHERFVSPHLEFLTWLISRLRADRDETDNKLTAVMLIGQILAFRPARSAILRHMGWSELGIEQVERIKATVRANFALQMNVKLTSERNAL